MLRNENRLVAPNGGRRLARALLLVAALAAVFVGDRMVADTPRADAANVVAIDPAAGGSTTKFNLLLPTSAACPTPSSSAGGDVLESFVLDDSIFPASSLGSIRWDTASGSWTPSGATTPQAFGVLFSGGGSGAGSPYTDQATLPVTGQIAPVTFGWPQNDFASSPQSAAQSGLDLYPGTFNVGIACVIGKNNTTTGVTPGNIDGSNFWSVQIKLTAASAGGFTWALASFPTSVSLSASPTGQAVPGASVTLTATVTPPEAKGTVAFYDGSTPIGAPQQVAVASGVATATVVTGSLPAGTDPLKAAFTPTDFSSSGQGTNVFGPSASAVLNYQITSSASSSGGSSGSPGSGSPSTGGSGSQTTPSGGSTSNDGSTSQAGSSAGGSAAIPAAQAAAGNAALSTGPGGLPLTGTPVLGQLLLAGGIIYIGLFVLSFAVPTRPRRRA